MTAKKYIDPDKIDFRLPYFTDTYGDALVSLSAVRAAIAQTPSEDVMTVEEVAEMLRIMFNDDCACNYNGNDEWLPLKCKYAEEECPTLKEWLACWKQFDEHFGERKEQE